MKIEIVIGSPKAVNRTATVTIGMREIKSAALNIAFAAERNRTGLYMRRHKKPSDQQSGYEVGPDAPIRYEEEPRKLWISEHIAQTGFGAISPILVGSGNEKYQTMPTVIAIPVSDVAANLLRPCFSKAGFGEKRVFFFEDEPIDRRSYWAACFFTYENGKSELTFMDVKFNVLEDSIHSIDGQDLVAKGLEWAVCLVPLVKNSNAVSTQEIAQNDYDLRHIFGRNSVPNYSSPYDVWYDAWNERVASLVQNHIDTNKIFEKYYHSILGIHSSGEIQIYQIDCELPAIARELSDKGIVAAGLLDSGGSCAIYDLWLGSYLSHGWYFREPRGAIIAFQLNTSERIPAPLTASWYQSSHKSEKGISET